MGLEFINKRKKELGFTNEDLSSRSGVPMGTLSKITSGITKDPKLETLKAIAKVLQCSLDDFDDQPSTNAQVEPSLSSQQLAILELLDRLNNEGQRKLLDHAELLVASRQFLKDSTTEKYVEFSQELA